jgi:uncharacterized protein
MPIPDDIRPLLDEVKAELRDLYGARLDRLVLYGSYARGDAHDESDVDLLVVLEGPVDPGREVRRMSELGFRLGLKHGVLLSTLPISIDEYASSQSAWLENARTEGQ